METILGALTFPKNKYVYYFCKYNDNIVEWKEIVMFLNSCKFMCDLDEADIIGIILKSSDELKQDREIVSLICKKQNIIKETLKVPILKYIKDIYRGIKMKRNEYEEKMFELRNYIADKFRDLQLQSQALKNVEDEEKNKQTITKMTDFIDEVRRCYRKMNDLSMEDIDEDMEENNNTDPFSCNF